MFGVRLGLFCKRELTTILLRAGYDRRGFRGAYLRPNFEFPKSGYGVRGVSITPGSRDFETRESYGRREINQP